MSRSRSRSPPPRERSSAAAGTKIFIGNLSYDAKERDLEELCAPFGRVQEVRLATDRSNSRPLGFGFVTMESADDAKAAVEGIKGKDIAGRAVSAEIAHGEGPRGGGRGRDRDSGNSDMDRARREGLCYDYIRGRCNRGDSCKFKHSDDGGRGGRRRSRSDSRDRRRSGRDRSRSRSRERRGRDRRSRSRSYDRDRRRSRSDSRDRRRSRSRDRGYGRDRSRSRDRR